MTDFKPHRAHPSTGDPHSAFGELLFALRILHQRLLAATQIDFEKLHGRVAGPGLLLQLAVNDPLFAWLRPLSQQIAALDEIAAEDIDADTVAAAYRSVAALIDEPGAFQASYHVFLQSHPDVVMAHAELRRWIPNGPG